MPTTPFKFTFVSTEDQSLTLRIEPDDAVTSTTTEPTSEPTKSSESMHSLRGAFSETVYIYGSAIETCLEKGFPPRVLSLGLGLGYVEVLAAALFLKKAQTLPAEGEERAAFLASVGGESFELLEPLRRWFANWVTGEDSTSHTAPHTDSKGNALADTSSVESLPQDFRAAYDGILARTAEQTGIAAEEIRTLLAELLRSGRWRIRGPLARETDLSEGGRRTDGTGGFGCICFDAFSSKTSPELWSEEFLKDFFAKACASECVLSTYACTGMLKRSLKASGFEVTIREGFSSKRDSTFAVRTQP